MTDPQLVPLLALSQDLSNMRQFFSQYANRVRPLRDQLHPLRKALKDEKRVLAGYEAEFRLTVTGSNEKVRDAEVRKLIATDGLAVECAEKIDEIEREIQQIESRIEDLEEDFKARQIAIVAVQKEIDVQIAVNAHVALADAIRHSAPGLPPFTPNHPLNS